MNNVIKKIKENKGSSLLELLIYIGILAGFLTVVTNLFFMISVNSAKEEARIEVQQNLQFAISQITNEICFGENAAIINNPISGVPENILNYTANSVITEFRVIDGVLKKIEDLGGPSENTKDLTNNNVIINTAESKIFTRIGDTIQINLEISYNDNGRPSYKFSQKIQTTVSPRF